MAATWKTVRVFISSTFRDMQAERDHLVRFVFPRLREELLKRRIHLVDVDLRWGVTSEQDAMEVCREVIDECRPRFICILGGRYGWVPPGKTRSITAGEVHYGVLDRKSKDRSFACFYFRDDAATNAMAETTPGELREPPGSENQSKLAELKRVITAAGLNPFTYPAQWDNGSRRLTGLQEFGDRIYDDLLAGIKLDPELRDRFVTDTTVPPDEFAEENTAMEAFVEEHSERFVLGSREPVLEELLDHAGATDGNNYLCLTGPPGSGKSALLAHFSRLTAFDSTPSTLPIRHFVGASRNSTDVQLTLLRLCHELKVGCPDMTSRTPCDPEQLLVSFSDLLRQACAHKRVVILLDAVDQFDTAAHTSGLHWLPEEPPANARVILSSVEGPALEELRRRSTKPREVELKPLTAADDAAIIDGFRKRYHKTLSDAQRAALLAKTDADTPLYLLAALEELRTLGDYEGITGRIAELPPTAQGLFAWILERLENDDGFRDAVGERVGHKLVPRFAALLGASRHGLSYVELVDLLATGDAKALPPTRPEPQGNVAALLYLLRPYLMRRGELLDFYHGQFRAAVENRFLWSRQRQVDTRKWLAQYFRLVRPERPGLRPAMFHLPWQFASPEDRATYDELLLGDAPTFQRAPAQETHVGVPNGLGEFEKLMLGYVEPPKDAPAVSRRVHEYPWQLAKAEQWQGLYAFLSDPILLHVLWQRSQYDALAYWAQLRRSTDLQMSDAYSQVLNHPDAWEPQIINLLAMLFRQQGYVDQASVLRRELTRLAEQRQDLPNLAGSLVNQGVVLDHRGELDNAIELYLKAENIYRQLGDNRGLAQCLGNRGVSLSRRENYTDAMVVFGEAERIARQVGDRIELQRTLGEQAVIFKQRGRLERSISLLKEKEAICRELGHRQGLAVALGNLALVLKDQGHPEAGLPLLDEVESIYREIGNEDGLRRTRQNRGHLLHNGHDIEGAMAAARSIAAQDRPEAMLEEEKELVRDMRAEDTGHPTSTAWNLVADGDLTQALQVLDACEVELRRTARGDLWRVVRCRAYVLMKQDRPQAALELCEKALDMMRSSECAANAMWTTKDFRFYMKSLRR
jgi:tetratricopeptide (TPR) repeat protein